MSTLPQMSLVTAIVAALAIGSSACNDDKKQKELNAKIQQNKEMIASNEKRSAELDAIKKELDEREQQVSDNEQSYEAQLVEANARSIKLDEIETQLEEQSAALEERENNTTAMELRNAQDAANHQAAVQQLAEAYTSAKAQIESERREIQEARERNEADLQRLAAHLGDNLIISANPKSVIEKYTPGTKIPFFFSVIGKTTSASQSKIVNAITSTNTASGYPSLAMTGVTVVKGKASDVALRAMIVADSKQFDALIEAVRKENNVDGTNLRIMASVVDNVQIQAILLMENKAQNARAHVTLHGHGMRSVSISDAKQFASFPYRNSADHAFEAEVADFCKTLNPLCFTYIYRFKLAGAVGLQNSVKAFVDGVVSNHNKEIGDEQGLVDPLKPEKHMTVAKIYTTLWTRVEKPEAMKWGSPAGTDNHITESVSVAVSKENRFIVETADAFYFALPVDPTAIVPADLTPGAYAKLSMDMGAIIENAALPEGKKKLEIEAFADLIESRLSSGK